MIVNREERFLATESTEEHGSKDKDFLLINLNSWI